MQHRPTENGRGKVGVSRVLFFIDFSVEWAISKERKISCSQGRSSLHQVRNLPKGCQALVWKNTGNARWWNKEGEFVNCKLKVMLHEPIFNADF